MVVKKIIVVLISLFILTIPKVEAISASSYIVMDMDTNRVIAGSNYNNQSLIASITKIMTCHIAIKYGDLNEKITVGDEVLKAFGSAIYIEVGEELTLKELLYGLMLRSGNDAAMVIAKNVAGSMENFVDLMNEEAKRIGMNNTIFYNNHGLEQDDGTANLSTAYDMALITHEAMQNSTFREIFKTKEKVVKTNYKTYKWVSKNKLIHSTDYIIGGKTGFTKKAHRTLVTVGSKDNKNIIVVTLNDGNDFADHLELYEKYFKEYKSVAILKKQDFNLTSKYLKDYDLYIKNDVNLLLKDNEINKVKIKYNLDKNKDILNDSIVGTAEIYLGKDKLKEEKIYATKKEKTVEKKSSIFTKIKGWFSW